jgi:8-oxo-dGTP pyrophosphatase MutT (NUDIX family)
MSEPQEPIPAATLVVMREAESGPPELLMVERGAAMNFAAGALVFPGGRIDPGDHALAATLPGDPDENAARIAAIRETLEEAGMAVGLSVADDAIPALRKAIYAGGAMGELFASAGATLDVEALVPFARWLPTGMKHRIFDTRFYLARAPENAPEPVVDGNENTRVFWTSAQAVLDQADAGNVTVIFPTRRNLERLAMFASFEDAVANARAYPIRTITPWSEERDGEKHLCIPDDLGYPVTSQSFSTAVRA